jgi:hypothetical protein
LFRQHRITATRRGDQRRRLWGARFNRHLYIKTQDPPSALARSVSSTDRFIPFYRLACRRAVKKE